MSSLTIFLVVVSCAVLAVVGQPLNSRRDLDSVFIAVKTSGKFHKSRLGPILDTWHRGARDQTFFFSDVDDAELAAAVADGHLVNTGCADDHSRQALSCKMEAELSAFLDAASAPAWFCHVDDDNYVNTARLAELLAAYPADQDWYLGKVSIPQRLEILDRLRLPAERRNVKFWFATGGAGFCLSRPLAEKMRPWVTAGRFQKLADDIRLPDDVTVGYLIEVLLGVQLTQVGQFHSHLEPLRLVGRPAEAVTLSYSTYEDTEERNVVEVEDVRQDDETRFYAVHCLLHPDDCRP